MLQEILNDLVMCSIEKDILEDINLDTIPKDFASGIFYKALELYIFI